MVLGRAQRLCDQHRKSALDEFESLAVLDIVDNVVS